MQERIVARKPLLDKELPGNHTVLVNSNLTLNCKIIVTDDASPPEISWLRHFPDACTKNESMFSKEGYNEEGCRLVDKDGYPMFEELQTCSINGNCPGGTVLDKPLEHSLTNLLVADTGWYSCRAANNYGTELSSGYVTVVTST